MQKYSALVLPTSSNHEILQRQSVAAGVDLSFAIVTGLVIIGFIFSLFIKEERHYNKNSTNTRDM